MNVSELLKYADTSVSITTVVFVLAVLVIGYVAVKKAMSGVYGVVTSVLGLFPLTLVASALMTVGGLTGAGYGVGELCSGEPPAQDAKMKPFTNEEIIKLANNKDIDESRLKVMIEYANLHRQKVQEVNDNAACSTVGTSSPDQTAPSITTPRRPTYQAAWMSLMGGIGAFVAGVVTFLVKINLPKLKTETA